MWWEWAYLPQSVVDAISRPIFARWGEYRCWDRWEAVDRLGDAGAEENILYPTWSQIEGTLARKARLLAVSEYTAAEFAKLGGAADLLGWSEARLLLDYRDGGPALANENLSSLLFGFCDALGFKYEGSVSHKIAMQKGKTPFVYAMSALFFLVDACFSSVSMLTQVIFAVTMTAAVVYTPLCY